MSEDTESPPGPSQPEPRCIVCRKTLQPGEERFSVYHSEIEYTVCCIPCGEKFRRNPVLYAVT